MVGPAADHPDQDVRKPETKVKAGKERKRNDYVKDKTLHASRLNKMHPSVYFKLQLPPKAWGLTFCSMKTVPSLPMEVKQSMCDFSQLVSRKVTDSFS